MTIVAWDGQYLAADSRSVRQVSRTIVDKSVKISRGFSHLSINGSPIEVVGQAGRVRLIKELLTTLKESVTFDSFLQWVKDSWQMGALIKATASLLFVTERSVWVLRISELREPSFYESPFNKPIAIGSGKTSAMFYMEEFGLRAPEAAFAVMLTRQCCGGPVNYVNCGTSTPAAGRVRKLHRIEFPDRSSMELMVIEAMVSHCNQRARRLKKSGVGYVKPNFK